MRKLLDYPEMGPARDDLFPGCRSVRVEQHVVYYQVTATEIVVGRVLHFRQDATGKVTPQTLSGERLTT
jgi:toxin ParE1/3/4